MAPAPEPLSPEAAPVLARALERAAGRAFQLANRRGQEARGEKLHSLTMSGLGGCPRQAAYRIAGVPPSDPKLLVEGEARQAMLGTWIHEGFLPAFAEVLHGADAEVPVELRVELDPGEDGQRRAPLVIKGKTDCYTTAMGGGVIDLKTLGAYMLGDVEHSELRSSHHWQVRGYATALWEWGFPVAWIAWLYMDRSSGEVLVESRPFTSQDTEETVDHVKRLHRFSAVPDYAPRGERGPGLSAACDGCGWLRRCWGPDAKPGDTSALQVHDREDIALAARKYKELAAEIKRLKEEQEVYGAMVGRPEAGVYGETVISYQRGREELISREAEELLRLHGITPPTKRRQGNRWIRWGRKVS